MKTELPTFKRCCLCIPLRRGLLTWGYIKMVLMIPLFLALVFLMFEDPVISWTCLATTVIDNVFNIILVIGAHKKHIRILFIYYYYGLAAVGVMIIITVITIIYCIYLAIDCLNCDWSLIVLLLFGGIVSLQILCFLLEMYLIFLVRSEILKLQDQRVFHYINANKEVLHEDATEADTQIQIKYDRLPNDV